MVYVTDAKIIIFLLLSIQRMHEKQLLMTWCSMLELQLRHHVSFVHSCHFVKYEEDVFLTEFPFGKKLITSRF